MSILCRSVDMCLARMHPPCSCASLHTSGRCLDLNAYSQTMHTLAGECSSTKFPVYTLAPFTFPEHVVNSVQRSGTTALAYPASEPPRHRGHCSTRKQDRRIQNCISLGTNIHTTRPSKVRSARSSPALMFPLAQSPSSRASFPAPSSAQVSRVFNFGGGQLLVE